MKLYCTCGIRHFVFDWPPAEIEVSGKKMMERHIFCPCQREVVVRTAPKDEVEFDGPEDSKKPKIYSQEALAKAMGLDVPPETERVNNNMPPENVLFSIALTVDEASMLKDLSAHYGNVFKQAPPKAEDQDKDKNPDPNAPTGPAVAPMDQHAAERAAYISMSEKIQEGAFNVTSAGEAKMIRCALSSRNVARRFPTKDSSWDDDPNVVGKKAAGELRERIYKELEANNV